MKKKLKLMLLLFFTTVIYAQENRTLVSGTVVSLPENEPIANAQVTVKGTFIETETNSAGKFTLPAGPNDELVVNALLMYPETFKINGRSNPYTIALQYNAEVLAAITLREKQEKEGYVEKDFVKKRGRGVGYSYEELQREFISGADVDMYTVARKIPMLDVEGNPLGGQVVYNSRMRGALGSSKVPMQVIIDGVPVDQNALAFINPRQVTNVTVYRSLAGTVKYGTFGAGGVMRITTTNSGSLTPGERKLPSLLAQGNDYDEGVLPISTTTSPNTRLYLDELERYSNVQSAMEVYEEQRLKDEARNLGYYLDVADHFSKWGDVYSYAILSDLYEQANKNPKILKAIAFKLEEQGHLVQAVYAMEELLSKHPDNIQAYRDVARLYSRTGKYNLAATLYKQMIYNTVPNVDFEPIHPIIFNEFRHLIANHKRKIDYKNIPNEFMSVNFNRDVRIVLEYTNPLAEFEVQFVSPSKKYYTWRHTYFDNKELIEDELSNGFALKEFLIEESDWGNWLVNVKSTQENDGAIPTLLKYTIYTNYGKSNETKEVKVINLARNSDKVTLDTFLYQ